MKEDLQISDWARLAAFIDGEGCISICTQGPRHARGKSFVLRIQIANTDPRLMLWLKVNFGGSITHRLIEGQRDRYDWAITAKKAQQILVNCLPYFVMKRDQAEVAIAFQATKRIGGWGREITEETFNQWKEFSSSLSLLKRPPSMEMIQ